MLFLVKKSDFLIFFLPENVIFYYICICKNVIVDNGTT
jgi:hypothetical protein